MCVLERVLSGMGPCVIYTCKYEETEHDVCVCVCV